MLILSCELDMVTAVIWNLWVGDNPTPIGFNDGCIISNIYSLSIYLSTLLWTTLARDCFQCWINISYHQLKLDKLLFSPVQTSHPGSSTSTKQCLDWYSIGWRKLPRSWNGMTTLEGIRVSESGIEQSNNEQNSESIILVPVFFPKMLSSKVKNIPSFRILENQGIPTPNKTTHKNPGQFPPTFTESLTGIPWRTLLSL